MGQPREKDPSGVGSDNDLLLDAGLTRMERYRRLRGALGRALWLTLGILAGWALALGWASRSRLDFPLILQAQSVIQRFYVDRAAVQPKPMTYGAISGMVNALGDFGHSAFLSPKMAKQLRLIERGELQGIGAQVQARGGRVVIVAPLDHSPAQRAGLRPGDVILKVNGQDIAGWPISRVIGQITGPPGTALMLTLLDPRSGRLREVTLTRASIRLREVTWARLPGTRVAHLRVASFNENSSNDVRTALQEIRRANARAIILDLRNNPGGMLDQAVAVASEFLKGGNVLLVKDAAGRITPTPALPGGLAPDLPLVALINQGAASAAEIVAGALRDSGRAGLVGETTFGTGTVLGEFQLSGGAALLLAVKEWLTPNGQSFWHKGIAPQIPVSLPDDVLPLFPDAERPMSAAEFQANPDRQLQRALEAAQAALRPIK